MRKLGFLALISLSVGVIGLSVGALWLAGSSSGQRDRFSSLQIAPADPAFFMAINTDPTSPQWLAVNDSLDAINAKDPIRQALDDALAEFELEWERDIVPVAGDEAFFAVPDIADVEGDRGFVAGVRTRDKDKAQDLIDRLRERAEREGEEFKEEEYEGVTIIYVAGPPDLDGDPATSSDCEVDASNTLLCDGSVPIPEEPYLKCVETYIELGAEGNITPEALDECQVFFRCPTYAVPEFESDPADLDGNGSPDSCDEVERIKRDRELSIELSAPYQDCADLEDISDYQCQGVPPVVIAQAAGVGGAVAIVDDVLVMGGVPDDVKLVIDVVQGRAPSAEGNERLIELRDKQMEDFLTWGYADLAPVWDMAESLTDFSPGEDSNPFDTSQPPVATVAAADFRVNSFDSEYTILPSGALQVKETIAVDFGDVEQRGIVRELPVQVSYDFTNDERIRVDNFVLLRDGVPESADGELIGDHFVHRFGDPAIALTGQHTYEFEYTVQGGVRQSRSGQDAYYELRWVATGDRWPVQIDRSSVTVSTPNGTIDTASCHVGVGEFGENDFMQCRSSNDGQVARFIPDRPIEPGAGLHFFIGVNGESGAPPPELVPADEFPLGDEDSSTTIVPDGAFPLGLGSEEIFDELRGRLDRVGFSVSSMNDGFAFDLTVLEAPGYEPDEPLGEFPGFEPKLAELLPADTMFYLSAFDVYNQAANQAGGAFGDGSSDGMNSEDFLKGFRDETGIDIEEDFLSLLTGEFAFAGNLSNFDAGTPDFELVGLADVSDTAKVKETFDKLGEYLQDQDVIEADADADGGRWSFVDGLGIEPIGWAVRDDRLIVGYPDDAASEISAHEDSLAEGRDWKRTLDLLPNERAFVGFVSIARVLEEIRKTEGAEADFRQSTGDQIGLEDLEAIRSLGFSANTEDDGFSFHAVLFVENN